MDHVVFVRLVPAYVYVYIAFDRSKIAIFVYPSCVYPPLPTEEFPWESSHRPQVPADSVKFYLDVNGLQIQSNIY